MVHLGCATWKLPKSLQPRLRGRGTHLARYATALPAVEINSSFYREHRQQLYEKWAGEVPAQFRFAVKLPKWLTHQQRLRDTRGLGTFLAQASGLGRKLGPLLIQLPPSLKFEAGNVEAFLGALRDGHRGDVVCEPRHSSWFDGEADRLLKRFRIGRVAADPPVVEGADDRPGGWKQCRYYRLHGRPRRFYSAYDDAFLDQLAERLRTEARSRARVWCIFNNTAADAGLQNALDLQGRLGS